jgi:multidrug efflux pump subunit AcrA (membrane-fusion protein)
MELQEATDLDSGSEAVRDFIQKTPNWLIQWGISIIFFVLLAGIFVSWLIEYPTIVLASFRLTSQNVPKPIVARTDGRILKLFVQDAERVQTGQVLAYIESTASHSEVLFLDKKLRELHLLTIGGRFDRLDVFPAGQFQQLGELQTAYESFMKSYTQTLSLFVNGYYIKRHEYLRTELVDLQKNYQQLLNQKDIYNQDFKLAQKEFEIHKKLYANKVIALLEYQREESKFIAKQLPIRQVGVSLINNSTAQAQKGEEISNLEREGIEQKIQFKQALNSLISAVDDWERRFCLKAPVSGITHFSIILQENQVLRSGVDVMYVGAETGHYFGEVRVPQRDFGKVRKGQKVLIKFQGYPFEEYGAVDGIIERVADVPSPDNSYFQAIVSLPNGLTTNYKKQLVYRTGMDASAEIVTEELRLIERVFYQFRRIITQR